MIECCKALNESLEPVRQTMPPNYTWAQLIAKASRLGVDLTSRKRAYLPGNTKFGYYSYGAAVSETVIDTLTGEAQITRTDILYDCGQRL